VEQYEARRGKLCVQALDFQTGESIAPAACNTSAMIGDPYVEMGFKFHGFFGGLPKTRGKNNAIWVIMDRLTKFTHFLAMANT